MSARYFRCPGDWTEFNETGSRLDVFEIDIENKTGRQIFEDGSIRTNKIKTDEALILRLRQALANGVWVELFDYAPPDSDIPATVVETW